jgi:hypothetical protein
MPDFIDLDISMAAKTIPAGTSVSLPAIERKDLRGLLEAHGLLGPIEQGEVQCASCGTRLAITNLGALLVRGSTLVAFCNQAECLEEAMGSRGQ